VVRACACTSIVRSADEDCGVGVGVGVGCGDVARRAAVVLFQTRAKNGGRSGSTSHVSNASQSINQSQSSETESHAQAQNTSHMHMPHAIIIMQVTHAPPRSLYFDTDVHVSQARVFFLPNQKMHA